MAVNLESILVTNAEGMVKTLEEARPLLRSAVTRVTIGSITLEPRTGNIGETYYFSGVRNTAWNSMGLPNPGLDATLAWLPEFRQQCHDAGMELAVSAAGFNAEEYAELTGRLLPHVDVVIANAGCGNMWKDNTQKPIPSYHPELLGEILARIKVEADAVDLKYSPVTDINVAHAGAKVMQGSGIVRRVIAVNTWPNQRADRDESDGGGEALAWREDEHATAKHTGGLSGAELIDVGEEVVTMLIPMLPGTDIIGCGGIFTGEDAARYLNRGARGIAIGTAFFQLGPRIFTTVLEQVGPELVEL